MVALGLFQDERVELLRGVLVKMSPQLAPHASTVQRLTQLLITRLQGRFALRVQSPLALSDDTEPEPDLAVVELGDYDTEHPTTARLVIEVSDTTLKRDRVKARCTRLRESTSTGSSTSPHAPSSCTSRPTAIATRRAARCGPGRRCGRSGSPT